jgi:hypothetical protein
MSGPQTESTPVDVEGATRAIDDALPQFARDVIRRHLDLNDEVNRDFLAHPDDREQHKMLWHQWGILTHTRAFLHSFDSTVRELLSEWGVWPLVDERLSATVDGVTRWELLKVSILLHDIGKYAARRQGRKGFHFGGHEAWSGEIIRHELALARFGFTPDQVEYVARTAEDHFVLGLLRRHARDRGRFDLDFPLSPEFRKLALEIRVQHPDDFLEIGVLFLGDSLSKAEPGSGLDLALQQNPINLAVAKAYLHIVIGE